MTDHLQVYDAGLRENTGDEVPGLIPCPRLARDSYGHAARGAWSRQACWDSFSCSGSVGRAFREAIRRATRLEGIAQQRRRGARLPRDPSSGAWAAHHFLGLQQHRQREIAWLTTVSRGTHGLTEAAEAGRSTRRASRSARVLASSARCVRSFRSAESNCPSVKADFSWASACSRSACPTRTETVIVPPRFARRCCRRHPTAAAL